jgi:hypothetical protein
MGIEVTGQKEVMKYFDDLLKRSERNIEKSLKKSSQTILEDSRQLAPKDTGNMIRESDTKRESSKEFHVRYNTDYSLYVHEDMDARHDTGQAKFLQVATTKGTNKVYKDMKENLLK